MSGSDEICITVDGETVSGHRGETVSSLMMRQGRRIMRIDRAGAPRGIFCGIGACYECLVTIDGQMRQGCLTPIRSGMTVTTGQPTNGEQGA